MEKIRKQIYESLKFYYEIAIEYVIEHYDLRLDDPQVEKYDDDKVE